MVTPQFTTWKAMESRLTALMTISALLAGFCLASATSVESSEITDYIEFVIVEFGENGATTKGATGMPDALFRKYERQAIDQRLGWNAMAACTVEMTVLAGTSMLCYVLTSGALGHNMKNEVLLRAFHAVTGWAVLAFQALSITGFWFFIRVSEGVVMAKFHYCHKHYGLFSGSACATFVTERVFPAILALLVVAVIALNFYISYAERKAVRDGKVSSPVKLKDVEKSLKEASTSFAKADRLLQLGKLVEQGLLTHMEFTGLKRALLPPNGSVIEFIGNLPVPDELISPPPPEPEPQPQAMEERLFVHGVSNSGSPGAAAGLAITAYHED